MALTRCAAIEAAPHGVRVNAVAPSLAMHAFLSKVTTDELLEELTEREAFGRAAEPWEVATVIAFLASDYSTYMTGEVVSVSSQRRRDQLRHPRRAPRRGRSAPRLDRLDRHHPGAGQPLRRRDRRPPVDPRRRRPSQRREPLRRSRSPTATSRSRSRTCSSRSSSPCRARRPGSTTAPARSASRAPCRWASRVRGGAEITGSRTSPAACRPPSRSRSRWRARTSPPASSSRSAAGWP